MASANDASFKSWVKIKQLEGMNKKLKEKIKELRAEVEDLKGQVLTYELDSEERDE